jgi:hypothetical protein
VRLHGRASLFDGSEAWSHLKMWNFRGNRGWRDEQRRETARTGTFIPSATALYGLKFAAAAHGIASAMSARPAILAYEKGKRYVSGGPR